MPVYVEIRKSSHVWDIVWKGTSEVIGYVFPRGKTFIVAVFDWGMATVCRNEIEVMNYLARNE